jgi:hypothetical protein
MAGHVVVRHIAVLGLEQDVACTTDQDRAEGVIAARCATSKARRRNFS